MAPSDIQRQGSDIRTKFLLRLGFETFPCKNDARWSSSSPQNAHHERTSRPNSFCETLKAELSGRPAKAQSQNIHETPQGSTLTTPTRNPSVSFCTSVTVILIPSRTDYSDRIKHSLWTSAKELKEQVSRNCVEYAFEDWDWRRAVEEPNMILYHGQMVHPCHFIQCNRLSARDHFLHFLAAEQAAQRDGETLTMGCSYIQHFLNSFGN
jgi:hypothetical protein